jgi:hypothetical protein
MIRAARQLDFTLVTNNKKNTSCIDGGSCFWQDLYVFPRPSYTSVEGLYPLCEGQMNFHEQDTSTLLVNQKKNKLQKCALRGSA